VTLKTAGSRSITATDTVTGTITGTQSGITVNPAAIDHYSVTAIGTPQVAGTAFSVTIQAQDFYNNNITTGGGAAENITITFGLTDAWATPVTTATVAGTATVGNMTMTVAQVGQTIIFTGVSAKSGTSNAFTVNPGAIDHYAVTAIGTPQVVGTAFSVAIQAQDVCFNNITTGVEAAESINITFGLADAGAAPLTTATVAGRGTVNDMTMTVAQVGQTIIFTGATSAETGTSNAFTVSAPPP
jgi:hypothetical protein